MQSIPDISVCELSNIECLERSQREKRKRRKRQENEMTLTVGIILLSYVICNLPVNLLLVLDPSAESIPAAHIPAYILAWISPVVNPLVYVIFNPTYRTAFVEYFKKSYFHHSCCT